ncbi:unnamed protein product [Cladocopium goreaui]|uniref:Calmodulin (CaM) n=1 Tax=Cladocopium goreaui TaxID=2562237 RepID=A0A9P1GII8_9DINO|nr:unnamed protein product [Cladocopium goreaui]
MRVIPEGQMAPAEPAEPAEPSAPDQDEILEIFKSCFSDETSVGKELLSQVLTQIGVAKADADAMLSLVNSGSSEVCYNDFVKFIFPPKVEEPFLVSYFRRIFQRISSHDEGVTKKQLHEVLESFEMSLPGETPETADAVAHIFSEIDHNADEKICWGEFYQWLLRWNVMKDESEDAARSLFTFLDRDGNGTIDAQEMMDALMLLSDFESKHDKTLAVTPAEVGLIIRDLAPDNDSGGIDYHTFLEVLHAARQGHAHPGNQQPHLVLNFDVNNTVVMLDSATGADSKGLIAMVLSNSAWGSIELDAEGQPISWSCQWSELTTEKPMAGLQTYTEFVVLKNPFPDKKDYADKAAFRAANEEVKKQRRRDLWAFTDPGMPGEVFHQDLALLQSRLMLPESLHGSQAAKDAGLTGEAVQLLPSFLHFLRCSAESWSYPKKSQRQSGEKYLGELKRRGRSFTLIFRTFGSDLPKLQKEIEALCEGWHPLFSKEDIVVLDGSDGCPDYRMRFDTTESCGTFFRNPAQDDFMALIMGSIEQPDSIEKGLDFYDDKQDVQIHEGWAAAGSSRGGKPFFLGRMDPAEHCIFFDDHITPLDPKIVDPVDAHLWPRRFSSAQLFGVHLVQAQPLLSIRDRDYFVKCFEQCEAARAAKLERWHKLKRIVADLDGVRKVLSGFLYTSVPSQNASFRPWSRSRQVSRAQRVQTFEEMGMGMGGGS